MAASVSITYSKTVVRGRIKPIYFTCSPEQIEQQNIKTKSVLSAIGPKRLTASNRIKRGEKLRRREVGLIMDSESGDEQLDTAE